MDIKIIVSKNVTSCAQLRVKRSKDSRHFFECGIDMVGEDMFISNYPPVYGDSFAELVTRILQWRRDVDKRNIDDIESVLVCDDSEACVCSPSFYDDDDEEYMQEQWDAYLAEIEDKKKSNKEELTKSKRAFNGLAWNEQKEQWEGVISI